MLASRIALVYLVLSSLPPLLQADATRRHQLEFANEMLAIQALRRPTTIITFQSHGRARSSLFTHPRSLRGVDACQVRIQTFLTCWCCLRTCVNTDTQLALQATAAASLAPHKLQGFSAPVRNAIVVSVNTSRELYACRHRSLSVRRSVLLMSLAAVVSGSKVSEAAYPRGAGEAHSCCVHGQNEYRRKIRGRKTAQTQLGFVSPRVQPTKDATERSGQRGAAQAGFHVCIRSRFVLPLPARSSPRQS